MWVVKAEQAAMAKYVAKICSNKKYGLYETIKLGKERWPEIREKSEVIALAKAVSLATPPVAEADLHYAVPFL